MLVAFSGLKGSGKDTAAAILTEEYGFTKIAFADAVREMALTINPYIPVKSIGFMWEWIDQLADHLPLADIIDEKGWDWAKREIPEVRRLLQVIGTEAGRMLLGENVWVDILAKKYPDISNTGSRYVITDCRFDNEVEFVRNHGGNLVWVERPGIVSDGHASESTHIKDLCSVIVHNDSTITEFQEDIRLMMYLWQISKV